MFSAQYICVFLLILKLNSCYLLEHHQLVELINGDAVCFL